MDVGDKYFIDPILLHIVDKYNQYFVSKSALITENISGYNILLLTKVSETEFSADITLPLLFDFKWKRISKETFDHIDLNEFNFNNSKVVKIKDENDNLKFLFKYGHLPSLEDQLSSKYKESINITNEDIEKYNNDNKNVFKDMKLIQFNSSGNSSDMLSKICSELFGPKQNSNDEELEEYDDKYEKYKLVSFQNYYHILNEINQKTNDIEDNKNFKILKESCKTFLKTYSKSSINSEQEEIFLDELLLMNQKITKSQMYLQLYSYDILELINNVIANIYDMLIAFDTHGIEKTDTPEIITKIQNQHAFLLTDMLLAFIQKLDSFSKWMAPIKDKNFIKYNQYLSFYVSSVFIYQIMANRIRNLIQNEYSISIKSEFEYNISNDTIINRILEFNTMVDQKEDIKIDEKTK